MKKIITIFFFIGLTGFARAFHMYMPQISGVVANTFDKATREWLLPRLTLPIIGSYWHLNALCDTAKGLSFETYNPSWVQLVNGRVLVNIAEEQVLRESLLQSSYASKIKNDALINYFTQYGWHYVGGLAAVVVGCCVYKLKNKKNKNN